MCGRYTLIRLTAFTDLFPWIRGPGAEPPPRYNIAPSQQIAVVTNAEQPCVEFFKWGLVPSWARDPAVGSRLCNARAETIAIKPAFREALRHRRCLIPADGFFEWQPSTHTRPKTPMYFRRRDRQPFAFAGLWEKWKGPDGRPLLTCIIITGEPNDLVRPIHDRMPVILPPENCRNWIDPREMSEQAVVDFLKPISSDDMETIIVGPSVNRPDNDSPATIEPAHPDAPHVTQPTLFG